MYTKIKKVQAAGVTDAEDILAAEEPLEIRLEHGPSHNRRQQSLTVTMRTPGQDAELVTGFLFTEGIITAAADIARIRTVNNEEHIIQVSLKEQVQPVLQNMQRNFFANSGCGVCGKKDIQGIYTFTPGNIPGGTPGAAQNVAPVNAPVFPAALIMSLPDILRAQQPLFDHTGGLHAAALFDAAGALLQLHEDIGRHNAVDKVIGAALTSGIMPLRHHLLLLSGRAGFELVQKAAMAGIPVVAAVGAPSSMAVQMAREWDITLIGFLREQRFNIYNRPDRVIFQEPL